MIEVRLPPSRLVALALLFVDAACGGGGSAATSGATGSGTTTTGGATASTSASTSSSSGSGGSTGSGTSTSGSSGGPVCPPPQIDCGGICVDVQTDPAHCGGCDRPCGDAAWWSCEGAQCADTRTWGIPRLVENDDVGDARDPRIAVDGSGEAVIVWQQSDGTRTNIWASRQAPGQAWSAPELIETDDAGDARLAQVATGEAGDAIAVWEQSDGMRTNIWANRHVPGQGWGLAQLLETDDTAGASNPQVAMAVSGHAVAVWQQSDGTRTNIWASRHAPGQGWSAPELLETIDTGFALNPQVAMAASGDAIAVWEQADVWPYDIWAARYVPGQGWSPPQILDVSDAGDAHTPQVAMNDTGDALAVWQQSDGTWSDVWASRFSPGQGWGLAERIDGDAEADAQFSRVAMDASGQAIAVWEQFGATTSDVWSNRHVPGQGWGMSQRIEDDDTWDAVHPQVAMDPSGRAVVVWAQADGARDNIWATRFTPSQGWSAPELVEEDDTGTAMHPRIAMDDAGRAVAVWVLYDGVRGDIWANVLE